MNNTIIKKEEKKTKRIKRCKKISLILNYQF